MLLANRGINHADRLLEGALLDLALWGHAGGQRRRSSGAAPCHGLPVRWVLAWARFEAAGRDCTLLRNRQPLAGLNSGVQDSSGPFQHAWVSPRARRISCTASILLKDLLKSICMPLSKLVCCTSRAHWVLAGASASSFVMLHCNWNL